MSTDEAVATEVQAAGELHVIPAVFEHAQRVYKVLETTAKLEVPEGATSSGQLRIWEGHLTQVFRKLGLPVPYYTLIKNHLVAMGCIEQLRRGGGAGMSKWVLWKEPTVDEWKDITPTKARRGNKTAMHEQQLRTLTTRVGELEEKMEGIMEVFHKYTTEQDIVDELNRKA